MWDYLIITASNALQAQAYKTQLDLRRELGELPQVRNCLVVADLEGKRVGSGGSTLQCLIEVLNRHSGSAEEVLSRLRILIVHAGGDSRRLPAYGPCGKIFVPIPDASGSKLPPTLFDRLVPPFLSYPENAPGRGQIVVAAGDALILLDDSKVDFAYPGITAIGAPASPEEGSRHGLFCVGQASAIRRFLQKPSIAEQETLGAIGTEGKVALDVGVMSMDGEAAAKLLDAFGVERDASGEYRFSASGLFRLLSSGIDLYVEICCALGAETEPEDYVRAAHSAGSKWSVEALVEIYSKLHQIPFHVCMVPECEFLHFGSTRQLIESGLELIRRDSGSLPSNSAIVLNTAAGGSDLQGSNFWVEGCQIAAPLHLQGGNVVVGVQVSSPTTLPFGACLDVLQGRSRSGRSVWFVRCYGIGDSFKSATGPGATFCGIPVLSWLELAGFCADDVWTEGEIEKDRNLWSAKMFPGVSEASDYREWLWMFTPSRATEALKKAFYQADRYSMAEMAVRADQSAFYSARLAIWNARSGMA